MTVSQSQPDTALSRRERAEMIWAVLKSYMLDECSLECASVSPADEKNLINEIFNSLPEPQGASTREAVQAPSAPCPTPAWGAHVSQPPAAQSDAVAWREDIARHLATELASFALILSDPIVTAHKENLRKWITYLRTATPPASPAPTGAWR